MHFLQSMKRSENFDFNNLSILILSFSLSISLSFSTTHTHCQTHIFMTRWSLNTYYHSAISYKIHENEIIKAHEI